MAQKMSFQNGTVSKVPIVGTVSKGPIVEAKFRNLEEVINRIQTKKSKDTKTKASIGQTSTYRSRRPNEEHLHFDSLDTLLKHYLKTEHPSNCNPSSRTLSRKVILTSRDHVLNHSKIRNKVPVVLSHRAPKAGHLYIRKLNIRLMRPI